MMRPTRPYGWKRDALGVAPTWDEHLNMLLPAQQHRVGALSSRNPSQLALRTRRLEQLRWSSCAAFALSSAMWTSARLNGWQMLEPPSMSFIYSIGRAREWAGMPINDRPPFGDTGMYLSLAIRAVQDVGFVSNALWPYDEEHVEREPSPDVFRLGMDDASGLTWSAMDEPVDRLLMVREALMSNAAVVFSMPVDRAFEMNEGEVVRSISERTLGEHGMRVLALDDDHEEVIVENWWDRWGIPSGTEILGSRAVVGCGRISYDLFRSSMIGNVNAIHMTPRVAR
jgi:hypothetical protein